MDKKLLIKDYLQNTTLNYKIDLLISTISYLKMGGIIPFFIMPENIEQLKDLIQFLQNIEYPYKVIGNASNCLFPDSPINIVMISLKKFKTIQFIEKENIVNAEAGVLLPFLVKKIVEKNGKGFEGLIGIPATLGGAVFMNAGAYGNEISDMLIDVNCLTAEGKIRNITKEECNFSFRYSMFQKKTSYIILSARFKLEFGNRDEINKNIHIYQINRRTYQETKYPNLGSTFRTTDIYKDLAKEHRSFGYILWFLRKANIIYGIISGRKNNKILNFLTINYFNIKFDDKKPFSDKTLNCLVNRGDLNFAKALEFINQIKTLLNNSVELEIEIVNEKTEK